LFTDPGDPNTQIHDFNPGIAENGVFWVLEIPDKSVSANPGAGKARMTVNNLEIEDYHDLFNALQDGPSVEAIVSFDVVWDHKIETKLRSNAAVDQRFTGLFTQTDAKVQWSASEQGFTFQSDPAETSHVVYAEVAQERNGTFF